MAGEAMLKKTEKIKQGPKMFNFESSKPRVRGGSDSVLPQIPHLWIFRTGSPPLALLNQEKILLSAF